MHRKFKSLQLATPPLPPGLSRIYLSKNDKTGFSINVSIGLSCKPTRLCSQYCYGLESRISLQPSLRRHVQNFAAFAAMESLPLEVIQWEARYIADTVLKRQSFLRIFGVGDLQPGSVRFINVLAEEAPALALWVATRKFDLASELEVRSNLHVMLSLDSSTLKKDRDKAETLAKRPGGQFYLAWVQPDPAEKVPKGVAVIFAEHHFHGGRATWTKSFDVDPRTCPATIRGGEKHADACSRCRYCFTTEKRECRNPHVLGD